MMNNKFISPECDVIVFENEDVITVSVGRGTSTDLPEMGGGLGE